ncbi:hypothetical protein [Sphingobacterium lactis]|uniref:Uncharacterized protein n=1 Tax=Sphingobacterium lactis TaxID=797291 RepID=A0A1H5XXC2_9SPHI|nr:hypothetical protein [Sphingobacterium lactis]SEG16351.1 hypothetical protein SAMN05421877_105154 [Sphingobacterium lactis]
MATPAWLTKKKEIPSEVLALIKDARVNGCWIYHESKRTFYTPEELEAQWDRIIYINNKMNNLRDFKKVTPIFAVRTCAHWLQVTNAKFQEVILKFDQYTYEFKSKK